MDEFHWWRDDAACKAAPLGLVDKAFARPGGVDAEKFKQQFCQWCEVADQCLREAMYGGRHEFGVWGSTSQHWRTKHGGPPSPAYAKPKAAA